MCVYGGVYLDGRCDSLTLALRRIMDVSECENSCSHPATLNHDKSLRASMLSKNHRR